MDMLGEARRAESERKLGSPLGPRVTLDTRWGEGDRDLPVDMLDTEAEDADLILLDVPRHSTSSRCLSRLRPLS